MQRPHATRSQVCFSCDSVHLASRLVQDMAQVFGISALTCDADFPKDMEVLRQLRGPVPDLRDAAAQAFAQGLRSTEAAQGLAAFARKQPAPWTLSGKDPA